MRWYRLFALTVIALYGASGLFGMEFPVARKRELPQSVRQSPGGIQSYHFWYGGIRGGK